MNDDDMSDAATETDYEQSESSFNTFDDPNYIEDDDISHPNSESEHTLSDDEDYNPYAWHEPHWAHRRETLFNIAGYGEYGIMEMAKTGSLQDLRDHVHHNVWDCLPESHNFCVMSWEDHVWFWFFIAKHVESTIKRIDADYDICARQFARINRTEPGSSYIFGFPKVIDWIDDTLSTLLPLVGHTPPRQTVHVGIAEWDRWPKCLAHRKNSRLHELAIDQCDDCQVKKKKWVENVNRFRTRAIRRERKYRQRETKRAARDAEIEAASKIKKVRFETPPPKALHSKGKQKQQPRIHQSRK